MGSACARKAAYPAQLSEFLWRPDAGYRPARCPDRPVVHLGLPDVVEIFPAVHRLGAAVRPVVARHPAPSGNLAGRLDAAGNRLGLVPVDDFDSRPGPVGRGEMADAGPAHWAGLVGAVLPDLALPLPGAAFPAGRESVAGAEVLRDVGLSAALLPDEGLVRGRRLQGPLDAVQQSSVHYLVSTMPLQQELPLREFPVPQAARRLAEERSRGGEWLFPAELCARLLARAARLPVARLPQPGVSRLVVVEALQPQGARPVSARACPSGHSSPLQPPLRRQRDPGNACAPARRVPRRSSLNASSFPQRQSTVKSRSTSWP